MLLALGGAWLIALAWAAWPALHRLPALRAIPLLGALWGGLLLVGAAAGGDDLWQPLQPFAGSGVQSAAKAEDAFVTVSQPQDLQRELDAAKARGQWVMLDYYADWCVSCKVMEKQVFARPDVLADLASVHGAPGRHRRHARQPRVAATLPGARPAQPDLDRSGRRRAPSPAHHR